MCARIEQRNTVVGGTTGKIERERTNDSIQWVCRAHEKRGTGRTTRHTVLAISGIELNYFDVDGVSMW